MFPVSFPLDLLFTTMAVINPPERKLAKRTSVQWCNAYTKSRILAYEDLALQCCSVQTASFFSAASTSGLDYSAQGATMRGVGAASARHRRGVGAHRRRSIPRYTEGRGYGNFACCTQARCRGVSSTTAKPGAERMNEPQFSEKAHT